MVTRLLGLLLVLAWVAPAKADPCVVTIVRAPDDVRAAVEGWLATERCGVPLAVRIVETEGELYIFAIDDKGGIRERTVPDAQSAGLLIASWTADDGLSNPVSIAPPVPAPAIDTVPTVPTVSSTGIDLGYVSRNYRIVREHGPFTAPPSEHWLMLAAGTTLTQGFAGRAEIEVLRHRGFGVSVITGIEQNQDAISVDASTMSTFKPRYTDLVAMLGVQHTWQQRLWHLRAGVAAGVVASSLTLLWTNEYGNSVRETASQVALVTEASALVGYALTDRWEAEAGPALTSSSQGWYVPNQTETLIRRAWNLAGFVGIRRAL